MHALTTLFPSCDDLLDGLQTLDLQHNHINDVAVVDIVSAMKDLRVLYLQGNPVVKLIRHYRKTLVSKCLTLKYLDNRYSAGLVVKNSCFGTVTG